MPGGGTSPVHISPLRQFRGDLGQSPTLSGPKLDNQPTDQQFLFIGNELAVLDAVAVGRLVMPVVLRIGLTSSFFPDADGAKSGENCALADAEFGSNLVARKPLFEVKLS